jgi:DNA-binding transcriptional LysR family regulator
MDFTLKQLRAFVTVAELEGIRLAADRMHVTPGAISLVIKDLEAQVGFSLFDRTTRRVTLTRAGREFFPAAVKVLGEMQSAMLAASDARSNASGVVRVAAPLIVAAFVLPPAIAAYREKDAGAKIRPVDCAVENLVASVSENHADLALGPDRPTGEDVERITVMNSAWVLWCSPQHALAKKRSISWETLQREDVIAAGRDYETGVLQALRHLPIDFRPAYIVDNVTTALGMAANNLGVTLTPAYVGVLASKMGLVMKPVEDPNFVREFSMFVPKRRTQSPAAAAFREFVESFLKTCLASPTNT